MQLALDLQPPRLDRSVALAVATRQAEQAINRGADKARTIDPLFVERAAEHMLAYLRANGTSSGELLTDSCKLAGIKSTDDRHFGAVFRALLDQRKPRIRWVGSCRRIKGHASRGGALYELIEVAR